MKEQEKLYQLIKEDPNLERYQKIEALINNNKEVQAKFAQLKQMQKNLVNAKHIGKQNFVQIKEKEYQKLLKEIEEIPLMSEYLDLQQYFNDLIVQISEILETTLNSKKNLPK